MSDKRLNPLPNESGGPLAKHIGNINHCWRCSHCKWVPAPQSRAFSHACPSVEWGGYHAYSGGGKVISAFAIKENHAPLTEKALETIFACSACGGCDVSCKTDNADNIEPLQLIYALRAKIAEDGKSHPVHKQMISSLRNYGNPYGEPPQNRSLWAKGLGIKDALKDDMDVLLHIGCEYAYKSSAWNELYTIVKLLEKAKVNFGILYNEEVSTGGLAHDLGFHDVTRDLASQTTDLFKRSGAKRVVTCSSASYSAVRNAWPRIKIAAPEVDFSYITDFILELMESGALEIDASMSARVTYHDPAKLGRLSEEALPPNESAWIKKENTLPVREIPQKALFGVDGLYESPRRLIQAVQGTELVEMERSRFQSYDCGAWGGAKEAYPEFAQFAAQKRLQEARATGAEFVVTACAKDAQHMSESAGPDDLQTIGIFEFLAQAMGLVSIEERDQVALTEVN